jgi:D-sedoheptulose 7-phosphate isomerase
MHKKIKARLEEALLLKQKMLSDNTLLEVVEKIAIKTTNAFQNGNKVLFCGNGGSAADAQHLAAELSGRYYLNRAPLNAEALHVNSSFVTAVANDFGYNKVFSRLVEAKGESGDVLFALSTSGNSENILEAITAAKKQDMLVVGFTGEEGGAMNKQCDYIVKIPSMDTPRIQEGHILIGHIICELVEAAIFGKDQNPEASSNTQKVDLTKYRSLFLDRDGVINHRMPRAYVSKEEDFKLFDGVPKAIAQFTQQFDCIVVVTNQAGIGKGLMTIEDLDAIHAHMLLRVEAAGGQIDAVYHCPELSETNSECRKPNSGMAIQAQHDFPDIDFATSIMVGDSWSDMEFGRKLGMATVLKEGEEELLKEAKVDFRFDALVDFASFLLV